MNQNHSSIWLRTIIYLGSAFAVFLVVIVSLLWFVGGERASSKVMLADAKRISDLEEQWVLKAEAARRLGPAAFDQFLKERADRAKSRRALAEQIESLETAPKNAKNQQDIRTGLSAGYASLQELVPGPSPFASALESAKKRTVLAFLIVFAALAGIVIILFRMIVRPLESIVRNARKVSEGELGIRFQVNTNDELGQLSRVMDSLTTNFRELLTLIQSSCSTGIELTRKLKDEESPQERDKNVRNLEDVFLKMREITEYFRQS
ncbi:MAG: HAMP domain-containing protein [bacterium]|nr:HAMP domain-containing protein [bacterium]